MHRSHLVTLLRVSWLILVAAQPFTADNLTDVTSPEERKSNLIFEYRVQDGLKFLKSQDLGEEWASFRMSAIKAMPAKADASAAEDFLLVSISITTERRLRIWGTDNYGVKVGTWSGPNWLPWKPYGSPGYHWNWGDQDMTLSSALECLHQANYPGPWTEVLLSYPSRMSWKGAGQEIMYLFKSNLRIVAVGAWTRSVLTHIDFDRGVLEDFFSAFDLAETPQNITQIS